MTSFFVVYETGNEKQIIEQFSSVEKLFEWLQNWHREFGFLPKNLVVFKSTRILDLS